MDDPLAKRGALANSGGITVKIKADFFLINNVEGRRLFFGEMGVGDDFSDSETVFRLFRNFGLFRFWFSRKFRFQKLRKFSKNFRTSKNQKDRETRETRETWETREIQKAEKKFPTRCLNG